MPEDSDPGRARADSAESTVDSTVGMFCSESRQDFRRFSRETARGVWSTEGTISAASRGKEILRAVSGAAESLGDFRYMFLRRWRRCSSDGPCTRLLLQLTPITTTHIRALGESCYVVPRCLCRVYRLSMDARCVRAEIVWELCVRGREKDRIQAGGWPCTSSARVSTDRLGHSRPAGRDRVLLWWRLDRRDTRTVRTAVRVLSWTRPWWRLLRSTESKGRHGVHPAQCVADAKDAVRWVRQHARELGVDSARIAVSGGSAGGHVAACTSTLDTLPEETDDSVSCMPNALVLYNPVCDTTIHGYGGRRLGDRMYELSPVHHLRAHMPPTLIFHGQADTTVPFENAQRFKDIMDQLGNACELVAYPDAVHGFFNPGRKNSQYEDTTRRLDEFLTKLGFTDPPSADFKIAGRTLAQWQLELQASDVTKQRRAAESIGQFGASAGKVFLKMLDHPDAAIRYLAAAHIGDHRSPSSAADKLKRLLSEESRGVQLAAGLCALSAGSYGRGAAGDRSHVGIGRAWIAVRCCGFSGSYWAARQSTVGIHPGQTIAPGLSRQKWLRHRGKENQSRRKFYRVPAAGRWREATQHVRRAKSGAVTATPASQHFVDQLRRHQSESRLLRRRLRQYAQPGSLGQ